METCTSGSEASIRKPAVVKGSKALNAYLK
jgi:hypothetical protein